MHENAASDAVTTRDTAILLLPKLLKKARKHVDAALQGDADGIHDLRVGLKRFREGLRLWGPEFRSANYEKWLARVDALNDALGELRDPQVLRKLLGELTGTPDPMVTRELAGELAGELTMDEQRSHTRLVELLTKWERRHWFRNLTRFTRNPKSYRSAAGKPVEAFAKKALKARVKKSATAWQAAKRSPVPPRLHAYRIANKHLRYALEPFCDELPNLQSFRQNIARLHDRLGNLHDCDALLARLETSAMNAGPDSTGARQDLLTELFRRRSAHFGEMLSAHAEFQALGGFDELKRRILAWGRSNAGGATERERKFLLTELPPLPPEYETLRIRQGYLSTGDPEERVRAMAGDGEEHFFHAIKRGEGETRTESEEEIPRAEFRRLWPRTKGHRLTKVRYVVHEGDVKWEIDQYRDRGLVIAEVEYGTPKPPPPPDWLKPYIREDVTGKRAYFNKVLATA